MEQSLISYREILRAIWCNAVDVRPRWPSARRRSRPTSGSWRRSAFRVPIATSPAGHSCAGGFARNFLMTLNVWKTNEKSEFHGDSPVRIQGQAQCASPEASVQEFLQAKTVDVDAVCGITKWCAIAHTRDFLRTLLLSQWI